MATPTKAIYRYARIAPRKARLVMDLIRGKTVDDAFAILQFNNRRSAVMISKVLKSAVANFNNLPENAGVRDELIVTEARIDGGPTIKRFQPKDRGKAHSIMKRTSHLVVSVNATEAEKEND
jgi:large subunit ribosomal protein L22